MCWGCRWWQGGVPQGCGRGDGAVSADGAPGADEGFAPSFKGLEVEVDVLVTVDGEILLVGCVVVVLAANRE